MEKERGPYKNSFKNFWFQQVATVLFNIHIMPRELIEEFIAGIEYSLSTWLDLESS